MSLLDQILVYIAENPGLVAVVSLFFVIGVLALVFVAHRIGQTEWYKANEAKFKLLDDQIFTLAHLVLAGKLPDLSEYEKKSQERDDNGEVHVDAYILYLIDQLDKRAASYGLDLDFDEKLALVLKVFQRIVENPDNDFDEVKPPASV